MTPIDATFEIKTPMMAGEIGKRETDIPSLLRSQGLKSSSRSITSGHDSARINTHSTRGIAKGSGNAHRDLSARGSIAPASAASQMA